MTERIRVLFVDDEQRILNALSRTFRGSAWVSEFVQSGDAALKKFTEEGPFDLVVTDQRMPGMTGVELLSILRKRYPRTVRVLLSAYAEVETVLDAINDGYVYKFLTKSCDESVLREAVEQIVQTISMRRQNGELIARMEAQKQELEAVDWMVQELDLCTPPPVTTTSLEDVFRGLPVGVILLRGDRFELVNHEAHALLTDRLQVQHTHDAREVIVHLESSEDIDFKKAELPDLQGEPRTVYTFWSKSSTN